jgi:hypothetical protein
MRGLSHKTKVCPSFFLSAVNLKHHVRQRENNVLNKRRFLFAIKLNAGLMGKGPLNVVCLSFY